MIKNAVNGVVVSYKLILFVDICYELNDVRNIFISKDGYNSFSNLFKLLIRNIVGSLDVCDILNSFMRNTVIGLLLSFGIFGNNEGVKREVY